MQSHDSCVTEQMLIETSENIQLLGKAFTMESVMRRPQPSVWKELTVTKGRSFLRVIDEHGKNGKLIEGFSIAGTVFPIHTHEGIETVFVYAGYLDFHLVEKDVWMRIGSGTDVPAYTFDATEPHEANFPVFCAYWAITKPSDKFW